MHDVQQNANYNCLPSHNTNTIVKFADDMTVVGLITKGNESANREEVQRLTEWCTENNLKLNTKNKTKITHYGLREEAGCPLSTEHQRGKDGEYGQLQIPEHTHLRGPHMNSQYHSAC